MLGRLKIGNVSNLAQHIATKGLDDISIHVRVNPEFGKVVWISERETKIPLCLTSPGEIKDLEAKVSSQLAFSQAVNKAIHFLGYKSTALDQLVERKASEVKGFQKLDVLVNHRPGSNLFPSELK